MIGSLGLAAAFSSSSSLDRRRGARRQLGHPAPPSGPHASLRQPAPADHARAAARRLPRLRIDSLGATTGATTARLLDTAP